MAAIYYCFPGHPGPSKCSPKEEHRLGRALLALALARENIPVRAEALPDLITAGPGGKPQLKEMPHVHFNISHCAGLIMCGIDHAPIGVDAENIRPFRPAVVRRVLTDTEQAYLCSAETDEADHMRTFFRFWTLKESWLKFTGEGLRRPLTDITFTLNAPPENKEKVRIESSEPDLYFTQFLTDTHVMSVCCQHEDVPVFYEVPADQFSIGSDQY